jgi:hypothetical protein
MKRISPYLGSNSGGGGYGVDLNGARIYIYVRTTGSDVTGNGSLATPYRTLLYAARTLPTVFHNGQYIIDITGITEIMDNATFPDFYTPDYYSFNWPGIDFRAWWYDGSVSVISMPTVLETVAAIDIASQVQNPSSELVTTTVNGVAWGIDIYKGKYLIDADGFYACIASNTADTLETTGINVMTGPLDIVDLTAELHNNNVGAWQPTLNIRASRAPLTFSGIKFTADAAPPTPSLGVDDLGSALFSMCNIDGLTSRACGSMLFSCCYFTGANDFRAQQVSVSGFLEACTFPNLDSECDRGSINFGPLVARACGPLGHVLYDEHVENGVFYIHNARIDLATGYGVAFAGGCRCYVNHAEINDCVWSAIYAYGPGLLRLKDVVGTGSGGTGCQLTSGAQVYFVGVTVTGSSDAIVGVMAPDTWANFATAESTIDVALPKSTGSRLFTDPPH